MNQVVLDPALRADTLPAADLHGPRLMHADPYDAESWIALAFFTGRCALPTDVDAGAAVFALGDTHNGRPLGAALPLPQPVIWYEDDAQFAAVAVQAEAHETDEGDTLEVLGLVLPDGDTAIAFLENIDEVDATDPVWRELLDEAGAELSI